jgi:hypothetical protein
MFADLVLCIRESFNKLSKQIIFIIQMKLVQIVLTQCIIHDLIDQMI